MTLYLDARTNCSDLMVDFIEVQLSNGEVVSLNWDESGIDRDNVGFSARYKGLYFDEEGKTADAGILQGLCILPAGIRG